VRWTWLVAKFLAWCVASRWGAAHDGHYRDGRASAQTRGARREFPKHWQGCGSRSGGRESRRAGVAQRACAADHITANVSAVGFDHDGRRRGPGVPTITTPRHRRAAFSCWPDSGCVVFGAGMGILVSGGPAGGCWACRIAVKSPQANAPIYWCWMRKHAASPWTMAGGARELMTGDIRGAVCQVRFWVSWPFDNVHMAHLPPRFNIALP